MAWEAFLAPCPIAVMIGSRWSCLAIQANAYGLTRSEGRHDPVPHRNCSWPALKSMPRPQISLFKVFLFLSTVNQRLSKKVWDSASESSVFNSGLC